MPYISSTDSGGVRSTHGRGQREGRRMDLLVHSGVAIQRQCTQGANQSRAGARKRGTSIRRSCAASRSRIPVRARRPSEEPSGDRRIQGMPALVHARHQRRKLTLSFSSTPSGRRGPERWDRQEFVTQLEPTRSIASVATRSFSPSPALLGQRGAVAVSLSRLALRPIGEEFHFRTEPLGLCSSSRCSTSRAIIHPSSLATRATGQRAFTKSGSRRS